MILEIFPDEFSVCKVSPGTPLPDGICFFARTDCENSLVCRTSCVPETPTARDDNWRMFRISGTLDFSLIGILARITALLAEASVSVFCVSTYDTDYVLVKTANLEKAVSILQSSGYELKYI